VKIPPRFARTVFQKIPGPVSWILFSGMEYLPEF
jgi:hypothetical protein